jgi:hypothetical protein
MATRYVWDAKSVDMHGANAPQLVQITVSNAPIIVLAFDAATDEICYLTGVAPQGLTGTLTLEVFGLMASATTGVVGMGAAVEAITPGDSTDLDTASSFDTINYATSATVPGTAGYEFKTTITLTNADSIAAGDDFRIEFRRDADATSATDSAAGDFYLRKLELRDTA